jgi:16S rRNA (adenine1518-N6/adenine1519-N6)-dimethyltransferase
MVPKSQPMPLDVAVLSELVQVAFSQRRKMLRHTLGVWLAQRQLDVDFDLKRRAEEVPAEAYWRLAQAAVSQ